MTVVAQCSDGERGVVCMNKYSVLSVSGDATLVLASSVPILGLAQTSSSILTVYVVKQEALYGAMGDSCERTSS